MNKLDRTDRLYTEHLRAYFNTFATYTTALSILVVTFGFILNNKVLVETPLLIWSLVIMAFVLCWQWHIATSSMRDQYRYFQRRMEELETLERQDVIGRFRRMALLKQHRNKFYGTYPDKNAMSQAQKVEVSQAVEDALHLKWSFGQLGKWWAMRGASLPVIYSAVFLTLGLASSLPALRWSQVVASSLREFPWSQIVAAACGFVWLFFFNYLVYNERKPNWKLRELEKLKKLLDGGNLSQDDFEEYKAKILN